MYAYKITHVYMHTGIIMIKVGLAKGLLLLLATAVVCEVCNENIIKVKIASDLELIQALQEIQGSLLQNVCYSLLFDFNATIELDLNQTFTIASSVSLQGSSTTIKCNISPSYNNYYAGIINVNNTESFVINGVSFTTCPSTFIRFENVSSISVLDCSFRYVRIYNVNQVI